MTPLSNSLQEVGAANMRHRGSIAFQSAEVMAPHAPLLQDFSVVAALRPLPPTARY